MNLTLIRVDDLWTLTADPQEVSIGAEPYERVVVELAGAVVTWPLNAPPGSWPTLTLTDVDEADWLWRWVGPDAHIAVHTAIVDGRPGLVRATVDHTEVAQVQRLGYGYWLRQWWPTSPAGDIPALDPVLLALELAVLTTRCDAVLGDGFDATPDLLATISAATVAQSVSGVPAARELLAELSDDLVPHWSAAELDAVRAGTLAASRRDDWSLAAGGTLTTTAGAVAVGRSSIDWAAVPAGIFDAAEGSLHWSVDIARSVRVSLAAQLLVGADPAGLAVWVALPPHVDATGRLDHAGRAELEIPVAPALAWTLDWAGLIAGVGPRRRAHQSDSRAARDRIRSFARSRLGTTNGYLAEGQADADDW